MITAVPGGVEIALHIQPRASRTEVIGAHGDALKIRLAAPPVDGEANDELVRFLAKTLGVTKSAVTIVRGATGRKKVVRVEGVEVAMAQRVLLSP
ncbi:MAG TPA: DUF167 domain-containing protein [Gemmatimonadales bacterium]|nr:DUF167 domain-containing protein [Gemmatimonadales bacterium]